jgi:hypothetical protein
MLAAISISGINRMRSLMGFQHPFLYRQLRAAAFSSK